MAGKLTEALEEGGKLSLSSGFAPTGAPGQHQLEHQMSRRVKMEAWGGSSSDVTFKSFHPGAPVDQVSPGHYPSKLKSFGAD